MQPESAAFVWDARRAAELAMAFVDGVGEAEYVADDLRRSAVERQLEILGEALNNLRKADPATAARVTDVNRIIGMRNVLAHGYAVVDDSVTYDAAARRLAALVGDLDGLLSSQPGGTPPEVTGV
ncbi:DUF86 domain-containing protein [Luteimicrobium sp. DT211]|uniref:HepT-like ribonuclease domain-containing protein n=1 Tax=Luteimicrobium sp. DT211 TaxID=3393412 RepID=UPI003CED337B